MLERDELGIIAQALSLILAGNVLFQAVWNLKIRPAEKEGSPDCIGVIQLVVESEKPLSRSPEVMKILNCGGIQESRRGRGRTIRQKTQALGMRAEIGANFAG